MALRRATQEDLQSYCHLWNAVWPNWALEAAQLARDDRTLPEPMRARRWLAAVDGEDVGFAVAQRPAGTFHLGKWRIDIGVASGWRGRGIGAALASEAEAHVSEADLVHVSTRVREGDAASLRFARSRGFREVHRDFESLLDLEEADAGTLEGLTRCPEGYRLASLSELDSPSFRTAFHALFEAVRVDIPRPEPPVPLTFTFFVNQVLKDPDLLHAGSWFALHGDEPVAFCGIFRGGNEGWADQWLTAVASPHRGRGLAVAVKAATVLWAKRAGFTTIRTDNNSENRRMLAINDRFGFRRCAAILLMRKT